MNRNQFDKTERQKVPRQVPGPHGQARSENHEPSKTELEIRHRQDRKG